MLRLLCVIFIGNKYTEFRHFRYLAGVALPLFLAYMCLCNNWAHDMASIDSYQLNVWYEKLWLFHVFQTNGWAEFHYLKITMNYDIS